MIRELHQLGVFYINFLSKHWDVYMVVNVGTNGKLHCIPLVLCVGVYF